MTPRTASPSGASARPSPCPTPRRARSPRRAAALGPGGGAGAAPPSCSSAALAARDPRAPGARLLALPATGSRSGCCGSATGPRGRSVVLVWRRLVLLRFREPRVRHRARLRAGHLADRARASWSPERRAAATCASTCAASSPTRTTREEASASASARRSRTSIRSCAAAGWFARIGAFFYSQTQLRIHVLVTRGFLRSLASAATCRPPRRRRWREERRRRRGASRRRLGVELAVALGERAPHRLVAAASARCSNSVHAGGVLDDRLDARAPRPAAARRRRRPA